MRNNVVFPAPLGADDPHDTRWRQIEIEVLDEQPITKCLLQLGRLDNGIAQTWSIGNWNRQARFLFVGALCEHLLIVVDTRFVLGATSLG